MASLEEILASAIPAAPVDSTPITATGDTPLTSPEELHAALKRSLDRGFEPTPIIVHPEGWRRFNAGECICAWDMLLVVPCPIHRDSRSE